VDNAGALGVGFDVVEAAGHRGNGKSSVQAGLGMGSSTGIPRLQLAEQLNVLSGSLSMIRYAGPKGY
jgi:hypothetical protein